jgi:hypothetical protein
VVRETRDKFVNGLPHESEARFRGKDGKYCWSLLRRNPVRGEQGRVTRWYAAGTDIDDHKQAQQGLLLGELYARVCRPPPKARQIMVVSVMKAHRLLIDNLTAARGSRDDNASLAGLIVTFFSGICLEQNLGPDRARITKKIDAFMRLIRAI